MAKVYCAYPYEGDHALVVVGEKCPVCGVEAVDRDVPSVNTLSELAAECKGICFMCAMPMTRIHRRQGESKSEARWYHDGHYPCLAQDIWHRFEETWPGYIATGQELNYGLSEAVMATTWESYQDRCQKLMRPLLCGIEKPTLVELEAAAIIAECVVNNVTIESYWSKVAQWAWEHRANYLSPVDAVKAGIEIVILGDCLCTVGTATGVEAPYVVQPQNLNSKEGA